MRDRDLYPDVLDRARDRSARRRTLARLENIPGTHDVDRCLVKALRRWLAARGVEEFEDLLDGDEAARSLVSLASEAVAQSGYDMQNPRTANRILVRLGLSDPMESRPRVDEFRR